MSTSFSILDELNNELQNTDRRQSGQRSSLNLKNFFTSQLADSVSRQPNQAKKSTYIEDNSLGREFDLVEELKKKLSAAEEQAVQSQKDSQNLKCDLQREKILFENKIQYYEKALEELSKRELDRSMDEKAAKNSYQQKMYESTQKFESQIRDMKHAYDSLKDKYDDMEAQVFSKNESMAKLNKNLEQQKWMYLSQINDLNDKINELSNKIYQLENNEQCDTSYHDINLENEIQKLTNALKNKEEIIKTMKSSQEKEAALYNQKCFFYEEQISELKNQIIESKKAHEVLIKAFEIPTSESETCKKLSEYLSLKESHRNEIKALQSEHEILQNKLKQEIESLQEQNADLEAKLKKKDATCLSQSHLQKLEQYQTDYEILSQEKTALEAKLQKTIIYYDETILQKEKNFQNELQEANEKFQSEIGDIRVKSEENLFQLKRCYEEEKERLEAKLEIQKSKANRACGESLEDIESRFQEEKENLLDEIQNLKDELQDCESELQNIQIQYENDINMHLAENEELKNNITELKNQLELAQSLKSSTLEQKLIEFNEERVSMTQKIETLTVDTSKKDLEIFSLKQSLAQLEKETQAKNEVIDQLQEELYSLAVSYEEKISDLKLKFQRTTDELVERKIEYCREMALSHQKLEFMQKKIEEFQKQKEEISSKFEQNLMAATEEYRVEYEKKVNALIEEKKLLETRLEKARKDHIVEKNNLSVQLEEMQTMHIQITGKLTNVEAKKVEQEKKAAAEIQSLLLQISSLKEDIEESLKEKNAIKNNLDLQIQSLQDELFTKTNEFEKDKILLDKKIEFLEKQVADKKRECVDSKQVLHKTIATLEKANQQNNMTEKKLSDALELDKIKHDYETKITQVTNKYQNQISSLESALRKAEKNLQASEKALNMPKPFQENISKHSPLLIESQNESLRKTYEERLKEIEKSYDNQVKNLKKNQELLEQRLKDSENRKTQLVFELERERAKWNLDKDLLENNLQEAQEKVARMERKKDTLAKENDKLRSDSRSSRRSIHLLNTASFSQTTRSPMNGLGGSLVRENSERNRGIIDITNSQLSNSRKQFQLGSSSNLKSFSNAKSLRDSGEIFLSQTDRV